MANYSHTIQKLRNGLYAFETVRGTIQERLYAVYLELYILSDGDFPPELQQAYRNILAHILAKPDTASTGVPWLSGSAAHTIRPVSEEHAKKIAEAIKALAAEISMAAYRSTNRAA